MTGPEHYREAEKLVNDAMYERDGSVEQVHYLAAAQVHATLAQAAATIFAQLVEKMPLTVDPNAPATSEWFAVLAKDGVS
jgi:hypothetical protein